MVSPSRQHHVVHTGIDTVSIVKLVLPKGGSGDEKWMLASMPKDKPTKLPYRRERSPALAALIRHVEAELTPQKGRGGIAWLAQAVGLRKQGVSRWWNAPIERVPQIAEATGLPMHEIRPDLPAIFPPRTPKRRKMKAAAEGA